MKKEKELEKLYIQQIVLKMLPILYILSANMEYGFKTYVNTPYICDSEYLSALDFPLLFAQIP